MKRGTWIIIIVGVVFLIIVIILAILFGGKKGLITSKSSGTTLTIWSPFNESTVYQQISSDYLQENPNIKLNFQYIPSTSEADYESQVTNAIASGGGPDIVLMRNLWLPKHVAQLSPADDSVNWATSVGSPLDKGLNNGQYVAKNFLNNALVAQNTFAGKLYGLPLSVDSLALYVNNTVINAQVQAYGTAGNDADAQMLRTIPQTWGQLATWSQLLTKKDSKGNITTSGLAIGTTTNTYEANDIYLAMLYQDNGSLFQSDNKTVNLNLANTSNATDFPAQDALSLFTSFSSPTSANYSWNESLGDPMQAFISGKTAMMIGDSTLASNIIKATNNSTDFVTIYPLPQPQQIVLPTQSRIDLSDYWTQVVSKNSKNKLAAWNYLENIVGQQGYEYSYLTKKPSIRNAFGNGLNGDQTTSGSIGDYGIFSEETVTAANVYMIEWQQDERAIMAMLGQVVDSGQAIKTAVNSAATALQPTTSP